MGSNKFSCSNKFRFRECYYWLIRILEYIVRYEETQFVLVVSLLSVIQKFPLRDFNLSAIPNIMTAVSERRLFVQDPHSLSVTGPTCEPETVHNTTLPLSNASVPLPGVFSVSPVHTLSLNAVDEHRSIPTSIPSDQISTVETTADTRFTVNSDEVLSDVTHRSFSEMIADRSLGGCSPTPFSYAPDTGRRSVAVVAPMSASSFGSYSSDGCAIRPFVSDSLLHGSPNPPQLFDSPSTLVKTPPRTPLVPSFEPSSNECTPRIPSSPLPRQEALEAVNVLDTGTAFDTAATVLSPANCCQEIAAEQVLPPLSTSPVQEIARPNITSLSHLLFSRTSKLLRRLTGAFSYVIPTGDGTHARTSEEKSHDPDCVVELVKHPKRNHSWHLHYVSLGRLVHSLLRRIRGGLIVSRQKRLRMADRRHSALLRGAVRESMCLGPYDISVGSLYKPKMSLAWTPLPSDIDLEVSASSSHAGVCRSLSVLSLPAHILPTTSHPGSGQIKPVSFTDVETLLRTVVRDVSAIHWITISTSSRARLQRLLGPQ
ncbi:unnamed protein product [Dicrocoelium dendriticum]|nr:unnamed protein product [Dicrocoelium dendriticum]